MALPRHLKAYSSNKRIALTVLVFLLIGGVNVAQDGVTVSGRVVDENTAMPLSRVTLVLAGRHVRRPTTVATDSTGRYRFTGVRSGSYTLQVDPSRVGPAATRITVTDKPLQVPDLRTHMKIEVKGRVEPRGWQRLMVTAYDNGGGVSIMPDGTFILRLEKGEYRIGVNIPKTHIVKSMRIGSRDLLKNPLIVRKQTQDEIKIILATK